MTANVAFLDDFDGRAPAPTEEAIAELPVFAADYFAASDVPPRRWIVPDMIPRRTVTIMGGDGAVGKSTLMKQLAASVSLGRDWIGTLPEQGPVVFVSAEDDEDELHRRVAAIADALQVDLTDLRDLHFVVLAGRDAVMAVPEGKTGVMRETPVWRGLGAIVQRINPVLVILDTLADVFAGNENDRQQARQFVGLLRGLAIKHDLAVVLIAHPSLSGLASGTGTSGSTAWNNSVRSRLYLETIKSDEGRELDPNLRVLKVKKSNYGPAGLEIRLRWADGCFVLDSAPVGFDKLAAEAHADDLFLKLLQQFAKEGRTVSANVSNAYAPRVFAAHPDAKGTASKALQGAMNRLMQAGAIRLETFGPPSKQRSHLVMTTSSGDRS